MIFFVGLLQNEIFVLKFCLVLENEMKVDVTDCRRSVRTVVAVNLGLKSML